MATQVQRRRGTTAEHMQFIGALAELTVDLDKWTVVVHDGVTLGGHPIELGSVENTQMILLADGPIASLRALAKSDNINGAIVHADPTILSQSDSIVGISQNAANDTEDVIIINSGSMEDPSWNWHDGPIFFTIDGVLTQTPPTSGYLVVIGKAVTNTKMNVEIGNPIILS